MRPSYLWTISTPKDAWNRVNDRVVNILGGCEAITSDRHSEKNEDWESQVGEEKLELIGYLYVLVVLMKNSHPDVAAQIQEILDLVVPADLTDPDARKAIGEKHDALNPLVAAFRAGKSWP